jgi:hypothetical protein
VVPTALYKSLQRHPWVPGVIESRSDASPAMLAYLDAMIGMFLAGGFTADPIHHALHALGCRLLGFIQELLNDSQDLDPRALEAIASRLR